MDKQEQQKLEQLNKIIQGKEVELNTINLQNEKIQRDINGFVAERNLESSELSRLKGVNEDYKQQVRTQELQKQMKKQNEDGKKAMDFLIQELM